MILARAAIGRRLDDVIGVRSTTRTGYCGRDVDAKPCHLVVEVLADGDLARQSFVAPAAGRRCPHTVTNRDAIGLFVSDGQADTLAGCQGSGIVGDLR